MGRRGHWTIALLLATTLAGAARGDDFDPHGRRKHPPVTHGGSRPTRPPSSQPAHPTAPNPATPNAGAALIDRYTKVVLASPADPFALQRLAQLYRERDGSLKTLLSELETRAADGANGYAPTVALAGLYKLDGRVDDAARTYEKAIAMRSNDPTAILALAHLLQERGDVEGARARFASALPMQHATADREQTLHALMTLALDAGDFAAAKDVHGQLVKMEPSSLFIRGELARELVARGDLAHAESELRGLVTASQGDNRALAPALKDLGKTLASEHKSVEALTTLKRALSVAGAEAGVKREVYDAITKIHRDADTLPQWVAELEHEGGGDFARVALLASLYEETGQAAKALAAYRRALAMSPRQIDLRLKMIRLLEAQGELDAAIAEYDGLIRAAPNDPQFVFEECEALLQRGDRARAMKLVGELEARATSDEDVLARVADFYQRIGEGERATKVLARLASANASDPSHLVDLGDRYYQDGNTALATSTWQRILTTVQPRSRALSILGDVLLEHDMTAEALAKIREAIALEPQSLPLKKQLAGALERAHAYTEAIDLWSDLAARGKQSNDKLLARESRTHLVTLWSLKSALPAHVPALEAAFHASPPDLEAGRTLAEAQKHLHRPADEEATLQQIVKLAPGDEESYDALEIVQHQQGKIAEAIGTLEKIVAIDPKRAREIYQRMAQYAHDMGAGHDAEAIQYAERAVAENPEDAEGHRKLAELYRAQQQSAKAIREYQAAIAKNDRLFVAYMDLAQLLVAEGKKSDADARYRSVLRGSPDDELVKRAWHESLTLNMAAGSLESLEQELLPLAIGNPQRPLYRQLLVETYDYLTRALVQRVKHAGSNDPIEAKDAEDARAALERIGSRAVKPLLDALTDADGAQQRVAIEVLGFVRNKSAGPALFAFATGDGAMDLRVQAMTACGALRDPALLPKYEKLLVQSDDLPADDVAKAAAWGVARMEDRRALPILRKLAKRGTADVRALAILGLGAIKDRESARELDALARGGGAGDPARAAAVYELAAMDMESDRALLVELAHKHEDALTCELAIMGLARMPRPADRNADGATIDAVATAVFASGDADSPRMQAQAEAVRRAGLAALVALAHKAPPVIDPLEPVDDAVNVSAILARVVPKPSSADARAETLVAFAAPIENAAREALTTQGPGAIVDALAPGDGAFEPFVGPRSNRNASTDKANEVARSIAEGLIEALVARLDGESDPAVRKRLVATLARSPSKSAQAAVVRALASPDDDVKRSALGAIGAQPDREAIARVQAIARTSDNWAMRQLAVEALGRLGAAGATAEAASALRETATRDAYALVREAALRALASFDPTDARSLAKDRASTDPEERVRATAREIANRP